MDPEISSSPEEVLKLRRRNFALESGPQPVLPAESGPVARALPGDAPVGERASALREAAARAQRTPAVEIIARLSSERTKLKTLLTQMTRERDDEVRARISRERDLETVRARIESLEQELATARATPAPPAADPNEGLVFRIRDLLEEQTERSRLVRALHARNEELEAACAEMAAREIVAASQPIAPPEEPSAESSDSFRARLAAFEDAARSRTRARVVREIDPALLASVGADATTAADESAIVADELFRLRHRVAELEHEACEAALLREALAASRARENETDAAFLAAQACAAQVETQLAAEQSRVGDLEAALQSERQRALDLENTIAAERAYAADVNVTLAAERARIQDLESSLADARARADEAAQLRVELEKARAQKPDERAQRIAELREERATRAAARAAEAERSTRAFAIGFGRALTIPSLNAPTTAPAAAPPAREADDGRPRARPYALVVPRGPHATARLERAIRRFDRKLAQLAKAKRDADKDRAARLLERLEAAVQRMESAPAPSAPPQERVMPRPAAVRRATNRVAARPAAPAPTNRISGPSMLGGGGGGGGFLSQLVQANLALRGPKTTPAAPSGAAST